MWVGAEISLSGGRKGSFRVTALHARMPDMGARILIQIAQIRRSPYASCHGFSFGNSSSQSASAWIRAKKLQLSTLIER